MTNYTFIPHQSKYKNFYKNSLIYYLINKYHYIIILKFSN